VSVSERFEDFLTAFLGVDENLNETARIIHTSQNSDLVRWLRPELDSAIREQSLSVADAEHLMARRFENSADVSRWLAGLRRQWFG
jgi:hypothetical protein